jgi:bilirubin oxidase
MVTSGDTWTPTLEVVQQASLNWYHSHIHGNTGRHVYNGLAGLFIIDDDSSDALGLPNEYGVDDVPLIIQDKLFDNVGNLDYTVDNIPGGRFAGNTMLVNGVVDAVLEVEAKRIRFRLLNASNARFYDFSLSDGAAFYKIATEGGLLNEPVSITSLLMAPGERNEIIIDLSDYDEGDTLSIQSSNEEGGDTNLAAIFDVLTLNVSALTTVNSSLPTTMNTVPDVDTLLASLSSTPVDRVFSLAAGRINNLSFDMATINHESVQGEYEVWDIRGGGHPFHMHGCSFLILDDNGVSPSDEDRGWKDTVVTRGGTTGVRVLVQFNYLAASTAAYMYHCHILGHEDTGMMGQFTVVAA